MGSHKISLINPCFPYPKIDLSHSGRLLTKYAYIYNRLNRQPIDLAYAASILRESSFEVEIIDANLLRVDDDQLKVHLTRSRPETVIITTSPFESWACPYPTIKIPQRTTRLVKEALPLTRVILIGPHGIVWPRKTLEGISGADFLIHCEHEVIIETVVKAIAQEDQELLKKLSGIAWRDIRTNEIRVIEGKLFVNNLDKLPFPAYDLLPMAEYVKYGYIKSELFTELGRKGNFSIVLSSRGCPYGCSFCIGPAVFGRKYRTRSPQNVIEELKYLYERFNVKLLRFQDLEFCLDKKRIMQMCQEIIREKLDIAWSCTTRFDSVDKELLHMMKKVGCYHINYGLESASENVLKKARKRINVKQTQRALLETSDVGIHASNNIIVGLPGEDMKTLSETLKFIKKMLKYEHVSFSGGTIPIIYPETELFELAQKNGLIVDSWEKFWKSFLFSGILDTSFKGINEVEKAILWFNLSLKKIEIEKTFGRFFFLKPQFFKEYAKKIQNLIFT